jgi:molybdopterin-guanine dinucleotide biosynthesis protein A
MGSDKRFLPYGRVPLVQHVYKTLAPNFLRSMIVAQDPLPLSFLDAPIVTDLCPNVGPLGGIAAALQAMDTDLGFVCACDIANPPIALVDELFQVIPGYDCAAPVTDDGRIECLFTFFRKSMADKIVAAVKDGRYQVKQIIADAATTHVRVNAGTLRNINTPEEYLSLLSQGK